MAMSSKVLLESVVLHPQRIDAQVDIGGVATRGIRRNHRGQKKSLPGSAKDDIEGMN